MLTRLARFDSKNLSISRIVFLAVENLRLLDCKLSLQSFNYGRYVKPPVGGLSFVESTDSVTWVGRPVGSCHSGWGEGRGATTALQDGSVGLAGTASINKERAPHPETASYQHCICNRLTPVTVTDGFTTASINCYAWPIVSLHWSSWVTLTSRRMKIICCGCCWL